MSRVLCWFSCGAASAVATKVICSTTQPHEVVIAYTHVVEEHSDNQRFLQDCEDWFDQPIVQLRNEKYRGSIYEVFRRERYLVGPAGAPCTRLLKRDLREQYQQPGDIHVLGFTAEEQDRADDFVERNPALQCRFPLIERSLLKTDCLAIIRDVPIVLPVMYQLGYEHNNCVGCVKGGMGYWNKIRRDFPEVFARMAAVERDIGATIIRDRGNSIYLDELDAERGLTQHEPSIECGIFCEMTKQEIR